MLRRTASVFYVHPVLPILLAHTHGFFGLSEISYGIFSLGDALIAYVNGSHLPADTTH